MINSIKYCIIPLLTLLLAVSSQAQVPIKANIQSEVFGLSDSNIPSITMPFVDNEASLAEDALEKCEGCKGQRFAIPFPVKIQLRDVAKEDILPDGSRVYRYEIICRDAKNINLLYSEFEIPQGGLFYIYAKDKSHEIGAFSAHNNRDGGGFATEMVHSDHIVLEYYEPTAVKDRGNIVISQIAHGYRGLDPRDNRRGLGASGSCQVDINCPEGNRWQDIKKGVGRITLNGSDHCSGSLIQAIGGECSPYFLTADHCLSSYDAISNSNASGFVFYFNYEYPGCNTGSGTVPTQTVSGATVVANDDPSDFALLLLDEDPYDAGYDVYYNGFDARSQVPAAKGSGIHHPSGDAKKIATHSMVPAYDDWFGNSPATSHLRIDWDATPNGFSVTEGGSSGSPLFDSTEQRILGQLHGGSSNNCSDPANDPGIYGHIAYSWENNGATDNRRKLKPWLDPNNTGILIEDGGYRTNCPYFVKFNTISTDIVESTSCATSTYTIEVVVEQAPTAPISLSVSASGTATNVIDYTLLSTNLTFPAGSTNSQFISLSIENDGFIEGSENISLALTNLVTSDPQAMLSSGEHLVTITDDDFIPQANFSADYTIGNGSGSSSGTDNFSPFRGYWHDHRIQNIYLASELTAAGMTAGNITALAYNVFEKNSTQDYENFTIKMKNTSTSSFASTTFETGTIQVFNGTVSSALGWNTITFDTPFFWDGTSNIIVESCFDNDSYTLDDGIYYDDFSSATLTINEYEDNDTGCSMTADHTFSERVQVRFSTNASTPIQTTVNSSNATDVHLGPNQTVYFYDQNSNNIMLSLTNLSSFDYGCTNVDVNRAGNNLTNWFSNVDVTNKSFNIATEFTPAADNVEVKLYYTTAEINTVISQINGMVQSDVPFSSGGSTSNARAYSTNYSTYDTEGFVFRSTVDKLNGTFGLSPCDNLYACTSNCADTAQIVSSPLVDSTFRASNVLYTQGQVKINNGRTVGFQAGQEVILNPEFEVQQGAQFEAKIQNCPD